MKKFLLFSFLITFSACSVSFSEQKNSTPVRFFPQEKPVEEGIFQPSIPENAISNEEGTLFFLFQSEKTGGACEKSPCILKIFNTKTREEIFSFQGLLNEEWEEKIGGFPVLLQHQNIITRRTQEKEIVFKEFFSAFDWATKEKNSLGEVKWWKPLEKGKNTIAMVKAGGKNFFFDAVSEKNSFRIYKILDPNADFFVKGSQLQNLELIATYEGIENFLLRNITPTENEVYFSLEQNGKIEKFSFLFKKGTIQKLDQ